MSVKPGDRVLARYIVDVELGKGGMGAVYRAHHERLGMPVAVKVLLMDDPSLRKRFEREAALMARVRHPNVVSVLDFGFTEDDDPVLVMEFVDGESLKDRIRRRRALGWREATRLVVDVLRGLEAIHQSGVVHRDMKPDNIAIAALDPEVAKVLDFGIARSSNQQTLAGNLTQAGMVVGTPQYMAPEQLMGEEPNAYVDVYAIGLILYEIIAGAPPLSGGSTQPMLRRLRETIPPPVPLVGDDGDLPEALLAALLASVHIDPGQRPDARGLRVALEAVLAGAGPSAPAQQAGTSTLLYGRPVSPAGPASPTEGYDPKLPGTAQTKPAAPPRPRLPMSNGPGRPPSDQPATVAQAVVPQTAGQPATVAQAVVPQAAGQPAATLLFGESPSPAMPAEPEVAELPLTALTPLPAVVVARGVLVAKLPPSRLSHPEERQWLAALAAPARGFALGSSLWFTLQAADGEGALQDRLAGMQSELGQRFGGTVVAASQPVPVDFKLSAAQLTGAKPLPESIAALIAEVSSGGGSRGNSNG